MTTIAPADMLPAEALQDAERAVDRCYHDGLTGVEELTAIIEAVEPHCRLAEVTWLADLVHREMMGRTPGTAELLARLMGALSCRIEMLQHKRLQARSI